MKPEDVASYMPVLALIVAILLTVATAALVFAGKQVPDEIRAGDTLAYAWFFVSSSQRGTTPPKGGGGSV